MVANIVGILNITPDSFSDGGKFDSLDAALTHTKRMIADGADVIDIGAESTRPGSQRISGEEEWNRLKDILPDIIKVVKNSEKKVKTSIDSYHFDNIKRAYDVGVDIINDVTGLSDPRVVDFIAAKNIETVLMHNEKVDPLPDTVINEHLNLTHKIIDWAHAKLRYLTKKGVSKSQLVFDVGIGFGKDANQSIRVLKYINNYKIMGLPVYVGHSKKSFLKAIDFSHYGDDLDESQKTLIISQYLINRGVDYLRVHDVKEHSSLIS
ncbi:MAG: dihydropteroate synthase [Rickettsiales bacterium]|nr:dihydropteroate synthase [Rickettsiales bacterium]